MNNYDELTYEFRYNGHRKTLDGNAVVSVNTNCYNSQLKFADELLMRLKRQIPFEHQITGEPEIHILGGNRKGMMSVEVGITFEYPDEAVREYFAKDGWGSELEVVLG